MRAQEIRAALSNLRRQAKLQAQIDSLQQQLRDLESDQFAYDDATWSAALEQHRLTVMKPAEPARLDDQAAADVAGVLADLNTSAIKRGARPGWKLKD